MMLNVFLGANFPNEKPKIVVTPRIQHEWIPDASIGEVHSAPGLLNVSVIHCIIQFNVLLIQYLSVHCAFRFGSCCACNHPRI